MAASKNHYKSGFLNFEKFLNPEDFKNHTATKNMCSLKIGNSNKN